MVSGVQLANMASAPLEVRADARTTLATSEIVLSLTAHQFVDATGTLTKMPVTHKLLG